MLGKFKTMKKIKLSKIKKLKVMIDDVEIVLTDKEEIRQTLQGNPFLKKEVELEVDDLKEFDTRNF